MKMKTDVPSNKKILFQSMAAFCVLASLCFVVIWIMINDRYQMERMRMINAGMEQSQLISESMTSMVLNIETLGHFIRLHGGDIRWFDSIASQMVRDSEATRLLIAPLGTVANVYPFEENEFMIGRTLFEQSVVFEDYNIAYESVLLANMAMEYREITIGGPFISVLGFDTISGRKSVFLHDEYGEEYFWGIVGISLRHPDALYNAGLGDVAYLGFDYEVWRINPYDGTRQIILDSSPNYNRPSLHYMDIPLNVFNADWVFRILSMRQWYMFIETWVAIFIGLVVSVMGSVLVYNFQKLKIVTNDLKIASDTDVLTGIYNRRYFVNTVTNLLEDANSRGWESYIISFDLDHFKQVNDSHGHRAGDTVLREITIAVSALLRPNDIFARWGGEEFIIFATNLDKDSALGLADRIRLSIKEREIKEGSTTINITASFGVTQIKTINKLEEATARADTALYKAKDGGRNRVEFL